MSKILILILLPIFLFSKTSSLSPMEKKSIEMSTKWMNNKSDIERLKDGSLAFYYGVYMPSIICKPTNATIIKLEEEEEYIDLRTGDAKRWEFDVVKKATDNRTFILIKPLESGIMTNLIIFTNKRIYNIKLISSSSNWTPSISFIYDNKPYESKKNKSTFQDAPPKHTKPKLSKYIIESDGTWKPNSIFTKEGKTYIGIDGENIDNIRLYIMNKNTSRIINYTYTNKYLVVNAIIEKAILIRDVFTKTIINIKRRK